MQIGNSNKFQSRYMDCIDGNDVGITTCYVHIAFKCSDPNKESCYPYIIENPHKEKVKLLHDI